MLVRGPLVHVSWFNAISALHFQLNLAIKFAFYCAWHREAVSMLAKFAGSLSNLELVQKLAKTCPAPTEVKSSVLHRLSFACLFIPVAVRPKNYARVSQYGNGVGLLLLNSAVRYPPVVMSGRISEELLRENEGIPTPV